MLNVKVCIGLLLFSFFILGIKSYIYAQASPSSIPVNLVQQKLKQDEALLEYFFTDSSLTIHAITTSENSVSAIKLGSVFWSSVFKFKKLLRIADLKEYSNLGQILNAFLFSPARNQLVKKKRIIIIPGEDFSGFPFEALIYCRDSSRSFSEQNKRYLIEDFEIIYHFSVRHWMEHSMALSKPDIEFIGFSPVFDHHPDLNPLPYSRKEITSIGALFKKSGHSVRMFFDQYSGKEYFKEAASHGRIIHLATHYLPGLLGHTCCGFLFWGYHPSQDNEVCPPGLLTHDEIGQLKLNADLIVLNACSSGMPFGNPGRPIQSTAWFFFQAGARNILSVLWNVTDLLANQFMVDFYKQCLSGKTYSQALREVKIKMIHKKETSLPTVWAPYIMIGQ
jgi:CHAT domain-containing protein